MSNRHNSDLMSAGPQVNVRRPSNGARTPNAGRRSPARRSGGRAGSRSPGRRGSSSDAGRDSRDDGLPDREALADKLNEMSKQMRDMASESTLLKSRLQRAETEGRQKDKTIDELLNANAGGLTDSSSLRRTQQQVIGTLKSRVGELETMLLEKEAALQTVANQPTSHSLAEVETERRIFYAEVRRLQQQVQELQAGGAVEADSGGGGGGGGSGRSTAGVGVGSEAEWRQLKAEVASLRMARAELNEQLEWAQTDRDEALSRVTSLEGDLAAQRSAVREGRSRVARLQVEKDDAVRENTRLRESVR
jgi:chromosome segregation ATPase